MANLVIEVVIRVDPETLRQVEAILAALRAPHAGHGAALNGAGPGGAAEDPEWLRQRYEVEGLTLAEIGRLCGVSAQTVSNRLKAVGIEVVRGRRRPATAATPAAAVDDPPVAAEEDPPQGQAD